MVLYGRQHNLVMLAAADSDRRQRRLCCHLCCSSNVGTYHAQNACDEYRNERTQILHEFLLSEPSTSPCSFVPRRCLRAYATPELVFHNTSVQKKLMFCNASGTDTLLL